MSRYGRCAAVSTEAQLPQGVREDGAQCAAERVGHPGYLRRQPELEFIDRHQRMVERRIRAARFTAVKSLDTFDFPAIPSLNKALVMELTRCAYIQRRENVIAISNQSRSVRPAPGWAYCRLISNAG